MMNSKKKTNHSIRFGHSLWSANQLLAQEARAEFLEGKDIFEIDNRVQFY